MAKPSTTKTVVLDWSKLLGFDQAPRETAKSGARLADPRLVKLGLAQSRSVTQSSRPDKHLYRISRDGRRALDAWLETVEPGARDTFFLKLFVGGLTTPDVLLDHLDQFMADTQDRLEGLFAIAETNSNRGHDWYHRLLLDYAIRRAELELDWAQGVVRALP